jgi:hypothetical protein
MLISLVMVYFGGVGGVAHCAGDGNTRNGRV